MEDSLEEDEGVAESESEERASNDFEELASEEDGSRKKGAGRVSD